MLPLCADQGVGVIPWSPLARGAGGPPVGRDDGPVRPDEYGEPLDDADNDLRSSTA